MVQAGSFDRLLTGFFLSQLPWHPLFLLLWHIATNAGAKHELLTLFWRLTWLQLWLNTYPETFGFRVKAKPAAKTKVTLESWSLHVDTPWKHICFWNFRFCASVLSVKH